MKNSFLLLLVCLTFIFITSCGQDYNSNFNDRGTYADIGIEAGTPLYSSYVIMQNKCFSCHASAWEGYKTNEAWIASGKVIPGNAAASPLITSLKNFGGDMPRPPISDLTDEEVATLVSWINGMTP